MESGRNFTRSWFNVTGEFLPDLIEDKNEIKVESSAGFIIVECCDSSRFRGDVFQIGVSVWNRLYDYQKVAVSWCWELFKRGFGGILGDDMGLGKTVQTAVFLRGLFKSGNAFRVLIISPLSVMNQWESELSKWCPRCRVVVFHGSSKGADLSQFAIPTVVLSTYDTFRNAKRSVRELVKHAYMVRYTLHAPPACVLNTGTWLFSTKPTESKILKLPVPRPC